VGEIRAAWQAAIDRAYEKWTTLYATHFQKLKGAKDDRSKAEQALNDKTRRHVHEHHSALIPYLVLMILIGVTEMFINGVVFQVLGQGKVGTWVMAAGLGIAFPLLAHFLGASLKRAGRMTASVGILLGVIALVLVGVVVLRERYVEATAASGLLPIDASPTLVTMLLLFVNVAIVAAAVYASFHHAVSDPQFEKTLFELEDHLDEIEDARALLERCKKGYYQDVEEAIVGYQGQINAYVHGNLHERRKGLSGNEDLSSEAWTGWYPPKVRRLRVYQDDETSILPDGTDYDGEPASTDGDYVATFRIPVPKWAREDDEHAAETSAVGETSSVTVASAGPHAGSGQQPGRPAGGGLAADTVAGPSGSDLMQVKAPPS
jgi:hypothetical protein